MPPRRGSHGLKHYTTPWKKQGSGKDNKDRTLPETADGRLYSLKRQYEVKGLGLVEVAWCNLRDNVWYAVLVRRDDRPGGIVPVSELIPLEDYS